MTKEREVCIEYIFSALSKSPMSVQEIQEGFMNQKDLHIRKDFYLP